MTLAELKTVLEGVTAIKDKVAYRAFPIGEAPDMPFVCYFATGSDNFAADNAVYYGGTPVRIELYEKTKNLTLETSIESALNDASIFWEREETYIDDELCYLIIYEVTIYG